MNFESKGAQSEFLEQNFREKTCREPEREFIEQILNQKKLKVNFSFKISVKVKFDSCQL